MSGLEFRCHHQYASSDPSTSGFTLDLEFITDRRVTALFGPSGSGKTTVLSLIAGFLHPTRGLISLQEPRRLLTEVSGDRRVRLPTDQRGIGFVLRWKNLQVRWPPN